MNEEELQARLSLVTTRQDSTESLATFDINIQIIGKHSLWVINGKDTVQLKP